MQAPLSLLFSLAISLETVNANDTPSLEEHNTIRSNYPIAPNYYQIDIDQQHADGISKILISINAIKKTKDELPLN